MKNIMNFEGMQLDFLTKEDVNFEFDGDVLFSGKQTAEALGYKDGNDAISQHIEDDCKYLITKEKLKGNLPLSLGQRGNWFISEDGVIDLTYRSKLPQANKFRKQVREIIKQVNKTGRYDAIENKIQEVEDETEKTLNLKIYKFEQILEIDPSDRMTLMSLNETKSELQLYKQQKQLEEVKNEVKLLSDTIQEVKKENDTIKQLQVFICNRTNFYERVKILANKCFGRDIQKTYNQLFNKMRTLGSFDVYQRQKNEWDKINAERAKEGKKPYKKSTLKQRCNYLDVIDDYNKWELASEAYKTIELEMCR